MNRILVATLLVLSAGVASAQPVTIGWRPPAGCTTNDFIKWNGTSWVCGTAGSTYTAGDGLTLTGSDFDLTYTSDFTITADQLDLSTAVTAPGTLAVVSTLTANGQLTIARGAAASPILAFTQTGQTQWQLYEAASDNNFRIWNSTLGGDACFISTAGALDCLSLKSNGASVNAFSTTNTIPKGNGTTLAASSITDDGTNVVIGDASLFVGRNVIPSSVGIGYDVATVTGAEAGWDTIVASSGIYHSAKLVTGTSEYFRVGAGTSNGYTNTWLTVDGSGNAAFAGSTTLGDTPASDTTTNNGSLTISGPTTDTLIVKSSDVTTDIYLTKASSPTNQGYIRYNDTNQTLGLSIGAASDDDLTIGTTQVTNAISTQLGNLYTADFVGINTAPDSNHQLTFSANVGNKIALYPLTGTTAHGFGVQAAGSVGQLQVYTGDSDDVVSFGYGDSDAFTETHRLSASGDTWLAYTGAGLATADGYGLLAVDSLYAGGAKDVADTFISGVYRPELGMFWHINWLKDTDTLTDGGGCANDLWCQNESGSTLAYTTTTLTSPRGVSETVGQLTCTDGGTACSAGGSDYRFDASEGGASAGSVPYNDARNLTVTFSVWLKSSSGTPTSVVAIYRDGAVESTTANCALNTSTWTRCTVTKTLSNTNLGDNSEIIVSIEPRTTSAIYMWGAQLEESAAVTPYQAKSTYTNTPGGFVEVSGDYQLQLGTGTPTIDQYSWAPEMHFSSEAYLGYDSGLATRPKNVSIYGAIGYVEADLVGVRNTLSVAGDTYFGNGPRGINTYDGTHFEYAEEYIMGANPVGSSIVGWHGVTASGGSGSVTSTSGRPGIITLATNAGATNRFADTTTLDLLDLSQETTTTYEVVVGFPTLSTNLERYQFVAGLMDTATSPNQVDGCFFSYDEGSVATNPGTGDTSMTAANTWKIWSASNSTRTGYMLDGTASEDSFTTVSSPVAALTLPNTNIYRLKVVAEGSTKCRFYIDGTEVGRITTNIPSGTTRLTGAGYLLIKSTGSTSRTAQVDWMHLDFTLSSARTP